MSVSPTLARQALAVAPATAEAWRALAFAELGSASAAAAMALARALAAAANALDFSNLAELRRLAGLAGAAAAARRAIVLDPALAAAHLNRGNLAMQDGRVVEADRVFARALVLAPASREGLYNRAGTRHELGDALGAVALYDRVLARDPDFFEARWNRALALLAAGRWREGWQAHECRRLHPSLKPRDFAVPDWTGEPLAGRRLLLAAEQGLGDTIQFLRYVPAVAAAGARIVLDVPASLRALASQLPVERLVASGEPVGEVDLHAPLMSLPLLLDAQGPPPAPPYLVADPDRRARWRAGFAGDRRPRVGIAWAGNPAQRNDRRRSLPDAALAALAAAPGLAHLLIVSLQKDRAAPAGWLDVRAELADFADTAALIAELDLVIAVDTAVAHLAGALARPLWVLLSPAADWRWPHGREGTPWYPSAQLIWQPAAEAPDWRPTLARLVRRLESGVRSRDARGQASGVGSQDEAGRSDTVLTLGLTPGHLTPDSCQAEGLALWRAGRLDAALDVLGRGLDAHPADAGLRTSFGLVLAAHGLVAEAACAWRQALAQDPAMSSALVNLAKDEGDADRARVLCRRALARDDADAAALGNLGVHEERRGDDAQARRLYRRALALAPGEARLWSNLGSLAHWAGRFAVAGRSLERALALRPDDVEARANRAINRLLQGDWRKGLADYEARLRRPGAVRPALALPSWRGEDIRAKRLLLWAEQGQGDVIQFLRFVPEVAARGASVILLVSRRLLGLVEGFAGVAEVAAIESALATPSAMPAADVAAPLLSLPFLLGLGETTPRAMPPYLAAAPARLSRPGDARPLVGLVWAGNPANQSDATRSLALVRLAPALALPGLRWLSLQFGPRAADIAAAGLGERIEDLSERLGDFAATARIVAALDLVVTVDTAMAHLAGALGKETWLLLAHVPDWRWGMSGETTSWYPSMRLFRQQRRGDWDGVVDRLTAALVQRFRLPIGWR